jgi:hypothetical protein
MAKKIDLEAAFNEYSARVAVAVRAELVDADDQRDGPVADAQPAEPGDGGGGGDADVRQRRQHDHGRAGSHPGVRCLGPSGGGEVGCDDAVGLRLRRLGAAGPGDQRRGTRELYDSSSWQVVEERVGGQVTAQYFWSPLGADVLIERDRDTNADGWLDQQVYVLQDANGDVTALVQPGGSVL